MPLGAANAARRPIEAVVAVSYEMCRKGSVCKQFILENNAYVHFLCLFEQVLTTRGEIGRRHVTHVVHGCMRACGGRASDLVGAWTRS